MKQCLADMSVLQSVLEIVRRIGGANQEGDSDPRTARVMSFYTALVVEMISEMPSITEAFLQHLLPVVLQGLQATSVFGKLTPPHSAIDPEPVLTFLLC